MLLRLDLFLIAHARWIASHFDWSGDSIPKLAVAIFAPPLEYFWSHRLRTCLIGRKLGRHDVDTFLSADAALIFIGHNTKFKKMEIIR